MAMERGQGQGVGDVGRRVRTNETSAEPLKPAQAIQEPVQPMEEPT